MKNADLNRVTIFVVKNGYVVEERPVHHDFCAPSQVTPYVFNTFEEMTEWLAGRLELPAEGPDAALTEEK